MKRRIRCTKFHFSTISTLRGITTSMLNFWTGGGAIELVLETPKLVRSLLMAISTSVPIFIIFLFSLHRVATEPHLPRKKNLTGIRSNIAASSNTGAKPVNDRGGAERQEQYGRNRMYRKNISSEVQNWTEVQMKEQTHVSDSSIMRTEDLTSGTKEMFAPLPTTAPVATRSCHLDSNTLPATFNLTA